MKQPSSVELTLRERALIDEARDLVSPSAADAARVKGKLWTTLKLGQTAAPGGEPSNPKSPGLALKQRVGLLTVGIGIGLAAGYGLGRQVDRPTPPPTMPSDPVIQPPHEDQGQALAGEASSTAPAATLVTPVVEPAGSGTRPPQHRDADTQRVGASPTPQTSNTPIDEIDEIDEVEWVQRVQRALAKGEPQLALGLLRHLDEALPNGRLLEERRAAEVIAHCQTSPEQGRARAAAFVQDFARSVHLARIQAACELKSGDE